jgi:hypothetical protein
LTIILLVGVEVSIKSPNSTVFAGVGAIWKLAPQDEHNTYGEVVERVEKGFDGVRPPGGRTEVEVAQKRRS